MKTTVKTLNYDASILEASAIMKYSHLRPVIDEAKCSCVKTKFIDPTTTNVPMSLNVCLIDKSVKGEFMYLTPVTDATKDKIICHISVHHESIKQAFGVDILTADHLEEASRYLEHLAKCRFYYEYEYKRTRKPA